MGDARRSRSVTMVLCGGAIVSWIGPFSSSLATNLEGGPTDCVLCAYPYFFLAMACFALLGLFAAMALRLPELPAASAASQVPLRQILRRPAIALSITSQVVVQFVMVVIMSATPLEMERFDRGVMKDNIDISGCIVAHVVAMFLPGFVTGDAIAKVGVFPVMLLGLLLLGSCNLVLLFFRSLSSFFTGLILLGVGFNCAFTSGTILLLKSHQLEERVRVTSLNEALRFSANAVAVLLSS